MRTDKTVLEKIFEGHKITNVLLCFILTHSSEPPFVGCVLSSSSMTSNPGNFHDMSCVKLEMEGIEQPHLLSSDVSDLLWKPKYHSNHTQSNGASVFRYHSTLGTI